jgi:phosphoribosyl 1,2-cyclic phosphate phosphodiesterase
MPTVTVLGSGTSNGVPMLGYRYPAGYLDNPKNNRTRSSIILQGPTGNLLVDCAPELRIQMTREQIYEVEAVLITHSHADHVMGMDDLRSLCMLQKIVMPIYTYPRYQADIQRIFPYAFPPYPPLVEVPKFDLRDVPETLEVGGMTIKPFQVWHGKTTPVVGLRCNDFAYVTDVSEIPPEAEALLQDLDVLILDAVRLKPHPNHFNLEGALAKIAELKPKRAYLTHLSHDYDHNRTNAELPEGVELAFDGLRVEI